MLCFNHIRTGHHLLSFPTLPPLLLLMLAHLLPNTPGNFPEICITPALLGISQHTIPIPGINMEKHRAAELFNFQRAERIVPPLHPFITRAVEDES